MRARISILIASEAWAVAFGLALVFTSTIALLQGPKPFYYDSGNYWLLGSTFVKNGDFSLLNYASPLRGYLLPLIDHGLSGATIAIQWTAASLVEVFNAFILSLIGAVLVPRLAELTWPKRPWGLWGRLATVGLLIVFWRGFLNFPLSDFPALSMGLLALISASRPRSPGWMLLCGLATGAAIDMRPAYALLLPIVAVLVVWNWVGERAPQRRIPGPREIFCFSSLLIGFIAVSLPQSLSTHQYFHTWSFIPGSAAHLESLLLTEGLRIQRYDTFVGTGHGPQMNYEYESGKLLLSTLPEERVSGIGQYLGLVVDHPLTMGGLFTRHIVNGLDERYSTPYIEHLNTGSNRWMRLAGFLLIFLALLRVIWPAARRSLGIAKWRYPVALILCCSTAVPSAMETRFMLPVCVVAYMLCLAPGWGDAISHSRARADRLRVLGVVTGTYLLSMALIWYIVSGTTDSLHFGI